MKKEMTLKEYDLRTLEHKMRKEVISKKDYEDFLKSIPDSTDNADYIDAYMEPESDVSGDEPTPALTFEPADF